METFGCGCNPELEMFKLVLWIDILSISCEIALGLQLQDVINDYSKFVKIMVWYR